jgi:hypothetical protein
MEMSTTQKKGSSKRRLDDEHPAPNSQEQAERRSTIDSATSGFDMAETCRSATLNSALPQPDNNYASEA